MCECKLWISSSVGRQSPPPLLLRRHYGGDAVAMVGASMSLGRPMVRRDGGGGFRLGPACLDGFWGRQGQRLGRLVLALWIVALGCVRMARMCEMARMGET